MTRGARRACAWWLGVLLALSTRSAAAQPATPATDPLPMTPARPVAPTLTSEPEPVVSQPPAPKPDDEDDDEDDDDEPAPPPKPSPPKPSPPKPRPLPPRAFVLPPDAPDEMPFRSMPIPQGYIVRRRPAREPLIIAGGSLLAVSYTVGVLAPLSSVYVSAFIGAFTGDAPQVYAAELVVPIAGPFIFMARNPGVLDAQMAVLGGAQLAGLGMLVGGLVMPEYKLVREAPRWTVVPVAGAGRTGIALAGTF